MPVRKPPKNFRSLTGAFYSHKNKKTIYFESKLEKYTTPNKRYNFF